MVSDFQERDIWVTAGKRRWYVPDSGERQNDMLEQPPLWFGKRHFRSLLLHSPLIVFHMDCSLYYTWVYSPADTINAPAVRGRRNYELFERSSDAAMLDSLARQVMEQGATARHELSLLLDGADCPFELTIDVLRDSDSRIIGVSGALVDCSARQRERTALQQQLERERAARKSAEDQLAHRDTMLAAAAHELRNPLTVLNGQIHLLRRRLDAAGVLSEQDQRAFSAIADQATRLNTLSSRLIDFTRLERGQFEITRAPVELGALLGWIVGELRPYYADYEIKLEQTDQQLVISGDNERLAQVFRNLIENAVKYSPTGSAINIQLCRQATQACVRICDHGIGIAAEELPRIFEQFYRGRSADTRRVSGAGIGLYLVQRLIKLHGGSIAVESDQGNGSTFTVYLPLTGKTF